MKSKILSLKRMVSQDSTCPLAKVTSTPADKHFYRRYNTTLRAIIPLPDPSAPPDGATHLNAYPTFSAGSIVMALYPDTSCFYRAEVVASPRDMQPAPRVGGSVRTRSAHGVHGGSQGGTSATPTYKLKFEDDDDQEHLVSAQWVVEWPGGS